MFENNWIAFVITLFLALAWLRINDYFAHKGWVSGPVSRKIIHIGTGPIFVLCWLFFSDNPAARYFAAVVPLAITLQFALVGLGIMKDQAAVDAMSRKGDRREILRGPLYYGIVFVASTLLFWKDSAVGIIALMLLCGGDGLADIVGKKVGTIALPWSKLKTLQGSIAMFLGGFLFSFLVLAVYSLAGALDTQLAAYLAPLGIISLVATVIESFPYSDIDNITVPVSAILLGLMLLP
jgi:phytol kinase